MKLVLIESHAYDVGYHYNMERTNIIKTNVRYINPRAVSSIEVWDGAGLNEGKHGSKVIMKSGKSYIDARNILVLSKELNKYVE